MADKKKPSVKQKVVKHLKEDVKEFDELKKDDKKFLKELAKKVKKK